MNTSRSVLITALSAILVFVTVAFSSCKSKCGSTTCSNGGSCSNNVCVCPVGYSGNACQTGWSDLVVGTYNCSRSDCNPYVSGVNSWRTTVSKSSTDGGETINFTNFNNSNVTITGTIDSAQAISIKAAGGEGVDASGIYTNANSTITMTFTTYSSGALLYKCQMTMVKI